MNANRARWLVIIALVAGASVLLGWQHQVAKKLRATIAQEQQTRAAERARLVAANRELIAHQLSPVEFDALRADRAAVAGLLSEVEAMKRRAGEATRASASPRATAEATHSMQESAVPTGSWRNAGDATPAAAFETALWASAAGEVESLAGLLALDADARTRAESIWARLPAGMRAELGTPERLVALMTARDVPLGSAQIVGQYPTPTETKLVAQLLDPDGKPKQVLISLRAEGDKWRLVVPGSIVERYSALLQTPVAVMTTGK